MKVGMLSQLFFLLIIPLSTCQSHQGPEHMLIKSDFKHYVIKFNAQNPAELHVDVVPDTKMIRNSDAWQFMEENIPFFECPDKEIEEVYYYRWWTFRKHIKQTPDGYVITEFMPIVDWSKKYNTISCGTRPV